MNYSLSLASELQFVNKFVKIEEDSIAMQLSRIFYCLMSHIMSPILLKTNAKFVGKDSNCRFVLSPIFVSAKFNNV